MSRSLVAASEAPFQPFEPRLTGTMVSIALPSLAKIGPATCPGTTPVTAANWLGVGDRLRAVRAGQAGGTVIDHDAGKDIRRLKA